MPEPIGSFAFRRAGSLLVALKGSVYTFDPRSGRLELFAQPEPDRPQNRFNDGRADRAGRFWAGTMCDVLRESVGSLYRVDPDRTSVKLFNDIVVPNSLAWSPDSKTMYFADTPKQCIWAFEFDLDSGTLGPRRVFRDTAGHPGRPDGSAVDSEGCLWNCEYGGWRVVRYRPDGEIDRTFGVPAANPTCCAFGGPDLQTLFVTSATQRLKPDQLAEQPHAGSVFAMRTTVAGLPESRFAG
jgi:sugar lactone lactonase YvrE